MRAPILTDYNAVTLIGLQVELAKYIRLQAESTNSYARYYALEIRRVERAIADLRSTASQRRAA